MNAARSTSAGASLRLQIVGVLLLLLTAWLALLSWQLHPSSNDGQPPILQMVLILCAMFAVYLWGVKYVYGSIAIDIHSDGRLLRTIWVYAVLMRITLLFSMPILELDLYRYIWDGAVVTQGVSPYEFSPQQVIDAVDNEKCDACIESLVSLEKKSPSLAVILRRIHYPELTTIYPPISQFVFATAEAIIPRGAPIIVHLLVIKCMLIWFDLATLLLVVRLLRQCGQPPILAIIYGWCPLLLKEIANSGHLDSIAICCSASSIYSICRFVHVHRTNESNPHRNRLSYFYLLSAAVLLALGIGAKLYPILLLAPATIVVWKRSRARNAIGFVALSLSLGMASLLPMLQIKNEPIPSNGVGITEFVNHWEINDFLFSVILDSVRPNSATPEGRKAWFAIVPNHWRERYTGQVSEFTKFARSQVSMWTAKGIAFMIWGGIVFVVLTRLARASGTDSDDVERASAQASCRAFLDSCFHVLAWFWLLSPTQNPWYWTWTLPMLAVVPNRAWLLVSGCTVVYYLRFWFRTLESQGALFGTAYSGDVFFDKIVVWFEFLPILVALCYVQLRQAKDHKKLPIN